MEEFDVAIIGAGIVGLAHAAGAVQRGLRAVVIERDARALGASIRNFGFVTVTGQRRGATWARARRSAAIWRALAAPASIPVVHQGLYLLARRREAIGVLEAFMATEMGEGCTLLSAPAARARAPHLKGADVAGALWSPHELRVESRTAIAALTAYLEIRGVRFLWSTSALSLEPPRVETSRGPVRAHAAIACPGDDLATLFPEEIAARAVRRCQLQMLRLAAPGFALPGAVMSDLSLARYRGYSDLPESQALRTRLAREQSAHLAAGVHLIAVQSSDGTMVVGDSHVYDAAPAPFASDAVDRLILEEYEAVFGPTAPPVLERWVGAYAAADEDMFMAAPRPSVRLVMVTSGTGASTAFAIAEETFADLFP